ncbi:MAG TPA: HAD-IA family hydrolase [Rhodocyclaceae bacterium]|nr:HAD-IA family hydrolase [Rhodocyclaceae bacterium]
MTRRYELIVFDWDGTLMDSADTIVACIQAAAVDMGMPAPSDERARHVIGLGLHEALRYALPELEENRHDELANRYRHHYLSQDHELKLFVGAAELVRDLAANGYLLGVATGKSRAGLDRALAVSGLGDCFHASRCADECHSKPHPQMLEELMEEFGVSPGLTLMIGDTTHDLEMARNAGVGSLAVTYGAHDREFLATLTPLQCADSVAELANWLRQNA